MFTRSLLSLSTPALTPSSPHFYLLFGSPSHPPPLYIVLSLASSSLSCYFTSLLSPPLLPFSLTPASLSPHYLISLEASSLPLSIFPFPPSGYLISHLSLCTSSTMLPPLSPFSTSLFTRPSLSPSLCLTCSCVWGICDVKG